MYYLRIMNFQNIYGSRIINLAQNINRSWNINLTHLQIISRTLLIGLQHADTEFLHKLSSKKISSHKFFVNQKKTGLLRKYS